MDDDGFLGRECLECERYFKLKPGTGLPTDHCHCPYCSYEGKSDTFWTPEQNEYAASMAKKIGYEKFIDPFLKDITKSWKKLERETRGSMFQIKVKENRTKPFFPIKYYREKELETVIECDNCHLHFAIYGVFSRCPDCTEINSFSVFKKSIEVSRKQFQLFEQFANEKETIEANLKFILANSISAFDALGKDLRTRKPKLFPKKPHNLFQNLSELEKVMDKNFQLALSDELEQFPFLNRMFQVRHIYEHNMGVVDETFVTKTKSPRTSIGKKYELNESEISSFLEDLLELGTLIEGAYKNHI